MRTDTTATGQPATQGPLPGPGPVAETFPVTLAPLEEDLWLVPLRAGVAAAVDLTGAASRRPVTGVPAVTAPTTRRLWDRVDPRPGVRRLRAGWRVGRLRAALPRLSAQLTGEVDTGLARLPAPAELTDQELLAALRWCRATLATVHAHEVLARTLTDDEVIVRAPVGPALPAIHAGTAPPAAPGRLEEPHIALGPRETLRLRARRVQELGAALAWEAGLRLHRTGTLAAPEDVRALRLEDLATATTANRPPRTPTRQPAVRASRAAAHPSTTDRDLVAV